MLLPVESERQSVTSNDAQGQGRVPPTGTLPLLLQLSMSTKRAKNSLPKQVCDHVDVTCVFSYHQRKHYIGPVIPRYSPAKSGSYRADPRQPPPPLPTNKRAYRRREDNQIFTFKHKVARPSVTKPEDTPTTTTESTQIVSLFKYFLADEHTAEFSR